MSENKANGKGFIFSIDAMFGAAIIIIISGVSIAQLELSSQNNPYTPLNLGANDEAVVGLYINDQASVNPSGSAYSCEYYYNYTNYGGLGNQGGTTQVQKCGVKT